MTNRERLNSLSDEELSHELAMGNFKLTKCILGDDECDGNTWNSECSCSTICICSWLQTEREEKK